MRHRPYHPRREWATRKPARFTGDNLTAADLARLSTLCRHARMHGPFCAQFSSPIAKFLGRLHALGWRHDLDLLIDYDYRLIHFVPLSWRRFAA